MNSGRQPNGAHPEDEKTLRIRMRATVVSLVVVGTALLVVASQLGSSEPRPWLASLLESLGMALIPTGLIALLYTAFAESALGRRLLNEFRKNVKVPRIYRNRDEFGVKRYIKNATGDIRILVTNLSSLGIPANEYMTMAKTRRVEVLCLDPCHPDSNNHRDEPHPFLVDRAPHVNMELADFFNEILTSIRGLQREAKQKKPVGEKNGQREEASAPKKGFDLKLYSRSPSLMLFGCEQGVVVAFVLDQGRSREHLHVEFDLGPKGDYEAKDFIKHFDSLWNDRESHHANETFFARAESVYSKLRGPGDNEESA